MIVKKVDLAVIGGGPAGLAAAVEAKKHGLDCISVFERDIELGGILQQCIHDGFGLRKFNRRMSGGQYAQEFIDQLEGSGIDIKLKTMVLEITKDKVIYAVNEKDGMMQYECRTIILAMGCRERTRSQVFLHGSRPSGVLTAGTVQRYINIEGYIPGKKAVILGSGDIGLIMARRMTLEGIEVEGVYEVMKNPGGLTRNIVQCLDDYNIPLHLGTTVVRIHGEKRLEGITIAEVDDNRKPVEGTERWINCDLLLLAVGLIPENELSSMAGVEIDPVTKGPVVDENFMTNVDGIFAAGNAVAVFDLVDYVSQTGEYAARGAVKYLNGKLDLSSNYLPVTAAENISYVLPQQIRISNLNGKLPLYMRSERKLDSAALRCYTENDELFTKRYRFVAPPEMIMEEVQTELLRYRSPRMLAIGMEEVK